MNLHETAGLPRSVNRMAIPPLLQRRLPDLSSENRQQLAASRVLVIGADALGLAALRYLAAAGVGTVGVLDIDAASGDDAPENEQLLATIEAIALSDASTTVTVHAEHLGRRANTDAAAAIIDGYNLVLDASDAMPVRFLVADTSLTLGLPLVWASVARVNGQLAVFPAAGSASGTGFRDLFPVQEPTEPQYAPEYLVGALRGQLGALMAAEAVKVLAGIGEPVIGRVLVIDADSGQFSEVSFAEAACAGTQV